MKADLRDALLAGVVAAFISGLPSSVWTFVQGGDPYRSTMAAGSIVIGVSASRTALMLMGVVVHLGVSITWALILSRLLPRRRSVLWGGLAGAGIAALDLLLIGRFFPLINALAFTPRLLDHMLYGIVVAAVLAWRQSQRTMPGNAAD